MHVFDPAAFQLLRRHSVHAISDLPPEAGESLKELARTLWPDISSMTSFAQRLEGDPDEDLETIVIHTPGRIFFQALCLEEAYATAERTARIP